MASKLDDDDKSVIVVSSQSNRSTSSQSTCAIVVLLGWWRSQIRHVQKYSKIYEERGCVTVTGVAPPHAIMSYDLEALDNFVRKVASQVSALIRDFEHKKQDSTTEKELSVIFHVFSNGGAYPLHRLEILIHRARLETRNSNMIDDLLLVGSRLKGQIYDSAPAFPHAKSALMAMGSAISNPVIRQLFQVAFLLRVLLDHLRMVLRYILGYGWFDSRQEFWKHLATHSLCLNQAYVYSTRDEIADVSYLEDLIAIRKQLPGSRVTVLKFDDSDHVQHLRTHEREYRNMINSFMEDVLHGDDKPTIEK